MNQCDGCRRGLPLVDGIHVGGDYDLIGCTADRYPAPCIRCNGRRGGVSKAGGSPICESCAAVAGELTEGRRVPRGDTDPVQGRAA